MAIEFHVGGTKAEWLAALEQHRKDERIRDAAPLLLEALKDAIGALEFSRDYHSDLSNAEQAFAQDKLDAAHAAITAATGGQ